MQGLLHEQVTVASRSLMALVGVMVVSFLTGSIHKSASASAAVVGAFAPGHDCDRELLTGGGGLPG